jgi:hypothetical protein
MLKVHTSEFILIFIHVTHCVFVKNGSYLIRSPSSQSFLPHVTEANIVLAGSDNPIHGPQLHFVEKCVQVMA